MTESSETESIKNFLRLLVQQVDALTTQTLELMPQKKVSSEYRGTEREIAASLHTRRNTLRQLAETILGSPDQSVGKSEGNTL
jgi:hypothetical protein